MYQNLWGEWIDEIMDNRQYPESIFGTKEERLARAEKWGDKKPVADYSRETIETLKKHPLFAKGKFDDDFPDDRNMNSQHVLRGWLEVNKQVIDGYKNFRIVRKNLANLDIGGYSSSNRFWIIYAEVNSGTLWTVAVLPYNIDISYKYRHIGKELPISKQEEQIDFQIQTLAKTIETAQKELEKYRELKKGL